MNDVPECGASWLVDGRWWIAIGLVLAALCYGVVRIMR